MKKKIKWTGILFALVLSIGLMGCSSSEDDTTDSSQENESTSAKDDEAIATAVKHMEEGDFDEAESALNGCFEGKAAELGGALGKYNYTVSVFFGNYGSMPMMDDVVAAGYKTGFQEAYDSFEEIDDIYKDYKPFKERINAWKDVLKDAIDYEADIRDDYEKMQDYLEKEDYDKCIEMSEDWNKKIEKKFPEDENAMNGIYLNQEIISRLENFTYPFSEENITYRNLMNNAEAGNGWDDNVDSESETETESNRYNPEAEISPTP